MLPWECRASAADGPGRGLRRGGRVPPRSARPRATSSLVSRQAPLAVVEVVLEPDAHVAAHRDGDRRQHELHPADPRHRTSCSRAAERGRSRPGSQPRRRARRGTPSTKSTWAGRRIAPSCARRFALERCPRSKISSSARPRTRRASPRLPRMIGKLFSKTSSPKFTVPQVSVAISGRQPQAALRARRASSDRAGPSRTARSGRRPADRVTRLPEPLDVVRVRPVVVAAVHVHDARAAARIGAAPSRRAAARHRQIRVCSGHDFGPDRRHGDDQRISQRAEFRGDCAPVRASNP